MYGDVVEVAETILKPLKAVFVVGQDLRIYRAGEKAFEEVGRLAQFFHCNSKLMTIANIQFAYFFRSPFRLFGPAIE